MFSDTEEMAGENQVVRDGIAREESLLRPQILEAYLPAGDLVFSFAENYASLFSTMKCG